MSDELLNSIQPTLPEGEPPTDRNEAPRRPRLPLFARIFYGLALFCLPLYLLFLVSPAFADFFNRYISAIPRWLLAKLTDPIPFSLAEFLLLMLPVFLFLAVRWGTKHFADSWRDVGIYCLTVLSLLALLFSIFTLGFASGYRGRKLSQKLELTVTEVSAEDLYRTALRLAQRINAESANVAFGSDGFSVMPYDFWEMNNKLSEAYDKACDTYDFVQRLDSDLKPVMLSGPMSYTHITGIYTFFTGEANLNMAFPDYTLPYTAAHELSHQRGIAREDEANFMAFLVCAGSSDPYLRYCAYLNLYDYVIGDLYSADRERYAAVQNTLCSAVRRERIAYGTFFQKYADSVTSTVTGAVNDTYLTLQGTEGAKSYGLVTDLAVAYFRDKSK